MYRISPFTYLVNGMLSTGLANNFVQCSSIEYVKFNPPSDMTCREYMDPFINVWGGYLQNNDSRADCSFCTVHDTNVFLKSLSSEYSTRWRNFGIMWAFVIFNIVGAMALYWYARVPRKQKVQEEAPVDLSRTQTAASRISRPATHNNEKAT